MDSDDVASSISSPFLFPECSSLIPRLHHGDYPVGSSPVSSAGIPGWLQQRELTRQASRAMSRCIQWRPRFPRRQFVPAFCAGDLKKSPLYIPPVYSPGPGLVFGYKMPSPPSSLPSYLLIDLPTSPPSPSSPSFFRHSSVVSLGSPPPFPVGIGLPLSLVRWAALDEFSFLGWRNNYRATSTTSFGFHLPSTSVLFSSFPEIYLCPLQVFP